MSAIDKAKNKVEELKGRSKRAAGAASGNPRQEREGRLDEVKSNLKQAGEKVKDAARRR
ncbi:MAG: CsbD family protein [Acidimicrobiales bacterium]